jgi:hypothetical protein
MSSFDTLQIAGVRAIMVRLQVSSLSPCHFLEDLSIMDSRIVSDNDLICTISQSDPVPIPAVAVLPFFAAKIAELEFAAAPVFLSQRRRVPLTSPTYVMWWQP